MIAYNLMRINRDKVETSPTPCIDQKEIYGDDLVRLLDAQDFVKPDIDWTAEETWPKIMDYTKRRDEHLQADDRRRRRREDDGVSDEADHRRSSRRTVPVTARDHARRVRDPMKNAEPSATRGSCVTIYTILGVVVVGGAGRRSSRS